MTKKTKKLMGDVEKLRKIIQEVNKATIATAAQIGVVTMCLDHLRTRMKKKDLVVLEEELQYVLDNIKEIK